MCIFLFFFFLNDTATTEIYTLSLHDALPISYVHGSLATERARGEVGQKPFRRGRDSSCGDAVMQTRSEEHTSELQSLRHLVCRLLLEKKKKNKKKTSTKNTDTRKENNQDQQE